MSNNSKELFQMLTIKLKVLHRQMLVDSTQYVTLFIRNHDVNKYKFQLFLESIFEGLFSVYAINFGIHI